MRPALHFDPSLLSALHELGELKRVRSASRLGSVAERLFLAAWSSLSGGSTIEAAMEANMGAAVAAARLGDLDLLALLDLGITHDAATEILRNSTSSLPGLPWRADRVLPLAAGPVPGFAELLARQPRAGITCPNRPRIVLEPPENHAEHCLAVAVYGVALSPGFGADPATVWLAGLAHHLHNAFMPDSGFTGEMLLGSHLEPMMRRATERALAELSRPLRDQVSRAREILPDAETPEGRAFHAADTLDRVWQIDQHLRAARIDLGFVLHDMALVHEGPVKSFQDQVLRAAGLVA